MDYDFLQIEKVARHLVDKKTFKADNLSDKPKYYILDIPPLWGRSPCRASLRIYWQWYHRTIQKTFGSMFYTHRVMIPLTSSRAVRHSNWTASLQNHYYEHQQIPSATDRMGFSWLGSRGADLWTKLLQMDTVISLKLFDSYYDIEADKAVPISELILRFKRGISTCKLIATKTHLFSVPLSGILLTMKSGKRSCCFID